MHNVLQPGIYQIHTFLTTYIHAKVWMINSENGEFKAIAIHLACYRNKLQSTELHSVRVYLNIS
jgi:hypothetical protein